MPITAVLRDRLALATCLERVRTDPADTWVYGYDNSRKHAPPDAVVTRTVSGRLPCWPSSSAS